MILFETSTLAPQQVYLPGTLGHETSLVANCIALMDPISRYLDETIRMIRQMNIPIANP